MTHLTILHTNDMHGRVEQLARIATLARQIRAEVAGAGGECRLLDAGDAEDTILLESSVTKGSAVMSLLRAAGYERSALGNASPLRYGPQVIPDLAGCLGQPLLCANMLAAGTRELMPGLVPYVLETAGDLSLGLIGLTTGMFGSYRSFGVDVAEPAEVLPALIARVRASGARTIIVLSHCGSEVDRRTAEQVPGIDVIAGGHDHVALDPPWVVNGVIVAQAGEYGRALGRLDLEIDPATGKVVTHHGELIPIGADLPPDEAVLAAYDVERARARGIMARVIGELSAPCELAFDRECAAGDLLADALLERVPGAQVALVVAGHWTTGLEAGPLSFGALNAANRSPANPARVELTGAQILQFLGAALKPENAARLLRVLRGSAVGWPHVAGMRVRYDPAAPERLVVRIGDAPLQSEARYVVAATDLEFYDFMGYLPLSQDLIQFEVPAIMTDVLEDYVARRGTVGAPVGARIAYAQA